MSPDRQDVQYGSLALMTLETLEALGPLHGYRIARRIEQISGNQLAMNQGPPVAADPSTFAHRMDRARGPAVRW